MIKLSLLAIKELLQLYKNWQPVTSDDKDLQVQYLELIGTSLLQNDCETAFYYLAEAINRVNAGTFKTDENY